MRLAALKWTNAVLLLVACIQACTGLWMLIDVVAFKKDAPEKVITIHVWDGLALVIAMAVHVALNWTWYRGVLLKRSRA